MMAPSSADAPFEGEEMHRIIRCNQQLKDIGIEDTVRPPSIAMVGDQSTGKSSLIEALSGVPVPRASDRCTQTPLAIYMTGSADAEAPWTCTVRIEQRWQYDYTASTRPTDSRPLGPWKLCNRMLHTFQTTHDKDEVCDLIQRAQSAILNPNKPIEDSLATNKVLHSTYTVTFSPNIVRLDISKGGWPTLSFVDLPGVFASSQTHHKHLITLVDNLVRSYVENPQTMLLITLPISNDIDNSKARSIIQDASAEQRALGVFTKADEAPKGKLDQYMNRLLHQDQDDFKHGYHIVQMEPDTNLSSEDARRIEAETFAQPRWSELGLDHRKFVGVDSLRTRLQHILFRETCTALPEISRAIENRLAGVDKQLEQLHEIPALNELPLVLEQKLSAFDNLVRSLVLRGSDANSLKLLRDWSEAQTSFRHQIVSRHPTLALRSKADSFRARNGESIEISRAANPSAVIEIDGEETRCRFQLDDIRALNAQHLLPGIQPYASVEAKQQMKCMAVAFWDGPLSHLMESTLRTLNANILRVIHEAFCCFEDLPIFPAISKFVTGHLSDLFKKESRDAWQILRVQQTIPYSDDPACQAKYETILEEYTTRRTEALLKILQAELNANSAESKSKKPQATADMLPPDDFKIEIQMAAEARAYYHIAAARFVDTILQNIYARLFYPVAESLANELRKFIAAEDPKQRTQLEAWIQEEPDVSRYRLQLQQEKVKLMQGKNLIIDTLNSTNLGNSEADTDSHNDPTMSTTSSSAKSSTPLRTSSAGTDTPPHLSIRSSAHPQTPTRKRGPDAQQQPPSTQKKLRGMASLQVATLGDAADESSDSDMAEVEMR